ncbi:MAG: hypothetical protein HY217_11765 [Candidatus Rokubacteria bacterium]|nr:hypothetical protein [Candidatus Rokubacteria bacterium]
MAGALDVLAQAARRDRKPAVVRFAEKRKLHAQTEEGILYPAALLVGECVKAKLQP